MVIWGNKIFSPKAQLGKRKTTIKHMRFLAFIVFLLFIVYALFARWYFVCEIRNLCEEEVVELRLKTLKLTEGDSITHLSGYDQFVFDSASVSPRMNANNEVFLDSVAYLLNENPAKNLNITGFYRGSESKITAGIYEEIGSARSNAIRDSLLKRKLEENRITLDYGISEDEELKEPLLFELYLPTAPDEFDKLAFSFKNMTFSDANFKFDSYEFIPGEAFLFYADTVFTYLSLNPEKSLTIIGHTDNKGRDKYNMELGLKRAEAARRHFKDMGVTAEIKVESEGEKNPVATNKTKEGQQRNRRVNFVLQ